MVSMFSPVRRYGCTNPLCAHEAILWKDSALGQRPVVVAAGLAGATVAGALAMGFGLYISSDESTRSEVRGAYTNVMPNAMQPDAGNHPEAKLELPMPSQLLEPKYETASMLEVKNQADVLNATSLPQIPAPASNSSQEAEPDQPR